MTKVTKGLRWGSKEIEVIQLDENGMIPQNQNWTKIPVTVKDSTSCTSTAGEKKEAPLSNGANKDIKYAKSKYTLVFELYAGGEDQKPIADEEGVILGYYAVRWLPENKDLGGRMIKKAKITVEETEDEAIGLKWKYTCEALEPTEGGAAIVPYFENSFTISPEELFFSGVQGSDQVSISGAEDVTKVESNSNWITVSKTGKDVTVTVSENVGDVRKGNIKVFVGANYIIVAVVQIKKVG